MRHTTFICSMVGVTAAAAVAGSANATTVSFDVSTSFTSCFIGINEGHRSSLNSYLMELNGITTTYPVNNNYFAGATIEGSTCTLRDPSASGIGFVQGNGDTHLRVDSASKSTPGNFKNAYVPAPGAVALLGAAGLIGTRRRRA